MSATAAESSDRMVQQRGQGVVGTAHDGSSNATRAVAPPATAGSSGNSKNPEDAPSKSGDAAKSSSSPSAPRKSKLLGFIKKPRTSQSPSRSQSQHRSRSSQDEPFTQSSSLSLQPTSQNSSAASAPPTAQTSFATVSTTAAANHPGDSSKMPSTPSPSVSPPPASSQLQIHLGDVRDNYHHRQAQGHRGGNPPPPPPQQHQQPHASASPAMAPSSPARGLSCSPRLVSPASSQIFERDVQDSVVSSLAPNSPAIPSHIKTENHIPPVLDASSEAITDAHLDPDTVEIITHPSHQPASAALAASAAGFQTPQHSLSPPPEANWIDELASYASAAAATPAAAGPAAAAATAATAAAEREDAASNYGSIDTADVRRLSFISFADVVLSEQAGHGGGPAGSRESIHIAGLTSLPSHRSPSPVRSPVSSQGYAPGTSPPTSNPGSVKGIELSPSRKPVLAATSSSGELSIETMSQALRRTGSTDMGAVRSIPTSPIEGPSR